MDPLRDIILVAPPILLALTFHEFAHAYVANRLGDPTAKLLGRLTLNPLVHLDWLGTAMLFIAHIGWAKPVPVNPLNFKNPKRDLLWVSLAGPGANLLLAFIFGLGCRWLGIEGLSRPEYQLSDALRFMVAYGLIVNIILAIFNILPIPPLDGSKIIMGLLPERYEHHLVPFLNYGPMILIAVIVLGYVSKVDILWAIINPFIGIFSFLFAGWS